MFISFCIKRDNTLIWTSTQTGFMENLFSSRWQTLPWLHTSLSEPRNCLLLPKDWVMEVYLTWAALELHSACGCDKTNFPLDDTPSFTGFKKPFRSSEQVIVFHIRLSQRCDWMSRSSSQRCFSWFSLQVFFCRYIVDVLYKVVSCSKTPKNI